MTHGTNAYLLIDASVSTEYLIGLHCLRAGLRFIRGIRI